MREEKDSIGTIQVPEDKYWGAQTERSKENFPISREHIPHEVIEAFAFIKKAAASVNCEMDLLSKEKRDLIHTACDAILAGKLHEHFPLVVWQTGSGTQTNMNVNEVISNFAIEKAGGVMGSKDPIHPNDDVNKSQSSNDTFPTAGHVAAKCLIEKSLIPSLEIFHSALDVKSKEWNEIIKVGRTHLMDAVPLTLGQEFSGFATQVSHGLVALKSSLKHLGEIALGGTAVGTGLNSPKGFPEKVASEISKLSGTDFISAPNKFEAIGADDAMAEVSGALKRLACSFYKIANDIRLLGSGPRCGIGELMLPANEPGSSIMPGKVNPTQCESMCMAAIQVIGNDTAIAMACTQGQFQLNANRPVMIYNLLQSIRLLADTAKNFTEKCLKDIEPHRENIQKHLDQTLMLATCLNTKMGYDNAAKIVKKAHAEGISLKESALALNLLTSDEFDKIVNPQEMV